MKKRYYLSLMVLASGLAFADGGHATALQAGADDAKAKQSSMPQSDTAKAADDKALKTQEQEPVAAKYPFSSYDDGIHFGGSVRLKGSYSDLNKDQRKRGGDAGFNLFQINVQGKVKQLILDAQWRQYENFQTIHHAWVGYDFNQNTRLKVGVTSVPFGIKPYSYNSYWGDLNYYLGFTDTYATGVKLEQNNGPWHFSYALFKNPAYQSASRTKTFSFHVVDSRAGNSETNQLNLQAIRHIQATQDLEMDVGGSVQGGQLYNSRTQENGTRWAAALHMNANWKQWNLKLEGVRYSYNAKNEAGVDHNFIEKGGFNFSFVMPAQANIYTIGLARTFNVNRAPIDSITLYNDFNYLAPNGHDTSNAMQNATGVMVHAGPVYSYLEWIAGKNTVTTSSASGIGEDGASADKWGSVLNFNIGYYF